MVQYAREISSARKYRSISFGVAFGGYGEKAAALYACQDCSYSGQLASFRLMIAGGSLRSVAAASRNSDSSQVTSYGISLCSIRVITL